MRAAPKFATIIFSITILSLAITDFSNASVINIAADYGRPYAYPINFATEYIFEYKENINYTALDGARIIVESEDATTEFPLIIIVRQKKGILSWNIPLQLKSKDLSNSTFYCRTSRNLCPAKYYDYITYHGAVDVSISLSTFSKKNIAFYIRLDPVPNFYMKTGETRKVTLTPAEPFYYGYHFGEVSADDNPLVLISAKSNNDVCMTLSVCNTTCPVFDFERNVRFAHYWQTVSRQGAITVPVRDFPNGLFIVMTVNPEDTECTGNYYASPYITDRTKTIELTVVESIGDREYLIGSFSVLLAFIGFCAIYVISIISYHVHRNRRSGGRTQNGGYNVECVDGTPNIRNPTTQESRHRCQIPISVSTGGNTTGDDLTNDNNLDGVFENELGRSRRVNSVFDLAQDEPKKLRQKTRLYVYYLITIAIFYTAPAIQVVANNLHTVYLTGNQDLCYYNYLCAHPLLVLSDFNHVFSNLGYILLGLLFIFIVYMREKYDESHLSNGYGIPNHYGLYYAMGCALILEGVMSGSYHICPNHTNFQFDTSFMYIISVLCMLKLYQNRHPDINAKAPVTFGVLSLTILLAVVGVLSDKTTFFWIFFTSLHLPTCLMLSIHIYYMGQWKFSRQGLCKKFTAGRQVIRPIYPRRMMLLIIGNCSNIGLAIYGNMFSEQDFDQYLLMILMWNLMLYTVFYITMKLFNRERIQLQPCIYIILSMLTWAGALYFFISKTVTWEQSPAESRALNRECVKPLKFYDYHDIWHFLSAMAMFFSFMVLLTLDDDLCNTHQSQMAIF